MRRKLIKQGKNALTVTLPAKWIEENNLKAGDEVDIDGKSDLLEIKSGKIQKEENLKAKINAGNYFQFLNIATCSLYRGGIDEIEINFSDKKANEIIHKQIEKQLIGFEVISQSNEKTSVKSLTSISDDSFDDMLKRLFSIIISACENAYKGISEGNTLLLENSYLIDRTINKSSNFIARILTKTERKKKQSALFYYALIRQLEELGDHYRDLCLFYSKKYVKPRQEDIKFLKKTNELVEKTRELFYFFKEKESDLLLSELKEMREEIKGSFTSRKTDLFLKYYLLIILETLKGIIVKVFDIKLNKDLDN